MSEEVISFNAKLNEQMIAVSCKLDDTVEKVKLTELSIQGRWVYKGRILADSLTIRETGIAAGECVIIIRSSAASASASASTSTPSAAPPPGTVFSTPPSMSSSFSSVSSVRPTILMDAAVLVLLSNSEEVVVQCITTVLKILSNITANPLDPKYRSIPAANRAFESKVGAVQGGPQLMISLGFELTPSAPQLWVLHPTAERWEALQACHAKLTTFSARLQQRQAGGSIAQSSGESTSEQAPALAAVLAALSLQGGPTNGGSSGDGGPSDT